MGVHKDLEKILKENGFKFSRTTNHGEFWTDGTSQILAQRPGTLAPRNFANFKADIRRALLKRKQVALAEIKELPTMNSDSIRAHMEKHGFAYLKTTRAGMLYFDGLTHVCVSPTVSKSKHVEEAWRKEVIQAIKKRPGGILEVDPAGTHPAVRFLTTLTEEAAKAKQAAREARAEKPLKASLGEKLADAIKEPQKPVAPPEPVVPVKAPDPTPIEATPVTPGVPTAAPVTPELPIHIEGYTPPPKPIPRQNVRRFTDTQRFPLWERIDALARLALSPTTIAGQLFKDGFRMTDGTPIDANYVSTSICQMPLSPSWARYLREKEVLAQTTTPVPAAPNVAPVIPPLQVTPTERMETFLRATVRNDAPVAPPAPTRDSAQAPARKRLPEVVVETLTDPDLSETQKLRMVRGFAEKAADQLPAAIRRILADSALSDEQRMAMLAGFIDL